MINFGIVATKIFKVLKGNGYSVKLYTFDGSETIDPEEARWFYVMDPNMMVMLDDKEDEIKMNKNSTLSIDVYGDCLKQIKAIAAHYILNFTIRNFGETVKPKQFSHIAKKQKKEHEKLKQVTESVDKVESGDVTVTNSRGIDFNVVFVNKGDKYGLNNVLTHDKDEPLVEFYDTRYPFTKYGQFVSRYRLSTIMAHEGGGIQLDGGVSDWSVSANNVSQVKAAAEQKYGKEYTDGLVAKDKDFWSNFYKKDKVVTESAFTKMKGSKKTSVQALEGVKIIVKHNAEVSDDKRGDRTRHIKEMYLQHNGERHKLPFSNMRGARAMARHVQNGGTMSDTIGEHIVNSTNKLIDLVEFAKYVKANKMINEENGNVFKLVTEEITSIARDLDMLSKQKGYVSSKVRIETMNKDLCEDDGDNMNVINMFTDKNVDNRVMKVAPTLKNMVSEHEKKMVRVQEASLQPIMCNKVISEASNTIQYTSKQAKLGSKISDLASCIVENEELKSYLFKVSESLITEGTVSKFDMEIISNVFENVVFGNRNVISDEVSVDQHVFESFVESMVKMERKLFEGVGDTTLDGYGINEKKKESFMSYSKDINGNTLVTIKTPKGTFSIQTNQNLPLIHSRRVELDSEQAAQEIDQYVNAYSSPKVKAAWDSYKLNAGMVEGLNNYTGRMSPDWIIRKFIEEIAKYDPAEWGYDEQKVKDLNDFMRYKDDPSTGITDSEVAHMFDNILSSASKDGMTLDVDDEGNVVPVSMQENVYEDATLIDDGELEQEVKEYGMRLKKLVDAYKQSNTINDWKYEKSQIELPKSVKEKIRRELETAIFRYYSARKGLGIANQLKDDPSRLKHKRRVMQNLNSLRGTVQKLERILRIED